MRRNSEACFQFRPVAGCEIANAQTLTLLGKLGGRNRRWLKAPQELPYREHTEHGMRLILTLLPATSFLVPLDKCLQFSLEAVAGKGKGADDDAGSHVVSECCISDQTSFCTVELTT